MIQKRGFCDLCPIEKDLKANKLRRTACKTDIKIFGDITDYSKIDYLFLTDTVEKENELKLFNGFIKSKGIENYIIVPAIGCRTEDIHTKDYKFPEPAYITYKYCNYFNIEKYNPKVVITLGKAFNYFTKDSVFSSWRDFREFLFNPTYFYPHIKSKWKGRIYPSAFIHDILFDFTSFEHNHFVKQIEFAKEHIKNYDAEKFIMPNWKVEKVEDVDSFLIKFENEKEVAADTETNSLNVFVDNFKVGSIQLSFDGLIGYYIPFQNIKNKRRFSGWLNNKKQIWANGKYDSKSLKREKTLGIHIDEDIPLVFHLMNIERDSNSIKILAWLIGFGGYEDELDKYKNEYKVKNYLEIPENILMPYAGIDGIVTYRLKEYLCKYLIPKQPEVYNLYKKFVIEVIPVFQSMEEEGLLVDKDYLKQFHESLLIKKNNIEQEIYKLVGAKFNIASNDDLGIVLEKMGLPDYGRVKKGLYQTGEDILKKWKIDGYKIAEQLLEYRKISKLDSTYAGQDKAESLEDINIFSKKSFEKKSSKDSLGLYQYIMSDNRIHGNIMPALTDSWRSLSFDPNLQNFPKRGKEAEEFRKIFIAPEDYLFCEADYSGFQFRLMAIYSKDKEMIKAFNTVDDLHSVTAQDIFSRNISLEEFIKRKEEEPYKQARKYGKEVNLAFAFGYTPFSFQNKINELWSKDQVKKYIQDNKNIEIKDNDCLTIANDLYIRFFKKYPELKAYMNKAQGIAQRQGYIDCALPEFLGLRRHLPELLHEGKHLSKEKLSHYSKLKNIAVNAGAQGGEAIIIYKSLIKIYNKIQELNLKSKLVGCVHDSLVLYVHKNEIEIMYRLLKECMEVFDYEVPILTEIEMGKIWGFSEKITEKNIQEFMRNYI